MNVIALDTCLETCSVAVCADDRVLASRSEDMTRGHQERLAPMAAEAMASAGLAFAQLDRVAVTVGPGSFTGLRVGLAFAKALALALDIPCIGLGLMESLAASVGRAGFVVVCVDARRGQLYLQVFSDGQPIMAPDALEPDLAAARLIELWPGGQGVIVGSGAVHMLRVLPGLAVDSRRAPDPVAVARLAQAARPPYPAPRPLYLRAPDAKLPCGQPSA